MNSNKINQLFNIEIPIIQGGMIWASGWRLASAVSNAGGLGLLGSGSMYPEVLKEHIKNCKQATNKPFGVNLPLLYPNIEEHIQTIISEKIPIVFTSAGNPQLHTKRLKDHGIIVVHVVSSSKFALKAQEAGCDAVVAEGFEAGGHNGREETTTMVLIPAVKKAVDIPVIAAGGIGTGKQMLAAMILGADGVQMGPAVSASQRNTDLDYIQIASSEGAQIVAGGAAPEGNGYFVRPTVLTHVRPDSRIAQEEVFGPVIGVIEADGLDEAFAISNNIPYGLSASLVSNDLRNAIRFAERAEAGMLKVNQPTAGVSIQAPFGGFKQSGSGMFREMGKGAIEFFSQEKAIYIDGQ
jgi:hypothetical protein